MGPDQATWDDTGGKLLPRSRTGVLRCDWAGADGGLMQQYHDREWGVPVHDDRRLFEFLCLEGAQAGLSWRTVLDKRARYRERFHDFDISRVAGMSDAALEDRLHDAGLIRNRRKIWSMRANARCALAVRAEHGTLDAWLWSLAGDAPRINHWTSAAQVPGWTPQSAHMGRALRKNGFRFVGPTICYAFMQATGMVNDHVTGCFRHAECTRLASAA